MKILAIPGSLREESSSNQLLSFIRSLVSQSDQFEIYPGIGNLPHFNDAKEISPSVKEFKEKVKSADVILICTPEYAFGIPGSLKNALDWTVSSGEFVGKRTGLVTASSSGEKGHAALLLVLEALSANVISDATMLISFIRSKVNADGSLNDPQLVDRLQRLVQALTSE